MCQKCDNCKFFCKLDLSARHVETIGGLGYVSGWKVEKSKWKREESYGCTVFLHENGTIHETIPNDICELFKPKENRKG